MKHIILQILIIKFLFVSACVMDDQSATTDDNPNIRNPQDSILSFTGASDGCANVSYATANSDSTEFIVFNIYRTTDDGFDGFITGDTLLTQSIEGTVDIQILSYDRSVDYLRRELCNDAIRLGDELPRPRRTSAVSGQFTIEVTNFSGQGFDQAFLGKISADEIIFEDGRKVVDFEGSFVSLGWVPG